MSAGRVSTTRLIVALCALAISHAALGNETLRLASTPIDVGLPPALGTPHPFEIASKVDYVLANGLTVTLVPFGTVPKATVLIDANTGHVADQDLVSLAPLLAELLKEGAASHSAQQMAATFADMGGSLNVTADLNNVELRTSILSEHLPRALALMADVLRRPTLPSDSLPRLKNDLTRAIAVARSEAQNVASEAFAKMLWGSGPFSHGYPSEQDIAAVTVNDARQFIAHKLGARRTHIYIAGQFDQRAVEKAIRRHFGSWATGALPDVNVPSSTAHRQVTLIDRPAATQSTILMGLPVLAVNDERYTELSVANSLLGGSLLSRLDQNLREAKGYTYGASSLLTPYHGLSTWTVTTDVNTPDTAAALHEIFKEISRLTSEPATAQELRLIQNYRAGHFVLSASSPSSLLSQLQFIDQYQLPASYLSHYVARTNAVTPDQVLSAASHAWQPALMSLVIVGDLAKIRAPLLALQELQGIDLHSPGME
jgi:predicted Zn-dependent peptidase